MVSSFADQIRGMLLLGTYGDAFGAEHESSNTIAPAPFPQDLPVRPMPSVGQAWGTWMPSSVQQTAAGIPSDDSCYRFFLLHPWLAEIAAGSRSFSEGSLREFLDHLRHQPAQPPWATAPRNDQINQWLEMFVAQEQNQTAHFFVPDRPVVFGMFLYGEAAAVIGGPTMIDTYRRFRNLCQLDQSYAVAATGWLAALIHAAIHSSDRDRLGRFDHWFYRSSFELLDQLDRAAIDVDQVRVFRRLLTRMFHLGKRTAGQSEHEHASVFHQDVVMPDHPPFMESPFFNEFDPLRFVAQMAASVRFSEGSPFAAIRSIALTDGDCDTTASFLGTLMGAWYGESRLRSFATDGFDAAAQLDKIEANLRQWFQIHLDQRVALFESLRKAGATELA